MRPLLILVLAGWLIGLQPLALPPAEAAAQQLSERSYRQLASIHALMEKERYDEALAGLDRMRSRVENRPYEQALLLQTYGHLHAREARYPQAITALSECLDLDALPSEASKQVLYTLAQLQLATADYEAAVSSLESWLGLEKEPAPAAHALAGTAYAYTKRYPPAVKHLEQAITLARNPDNNWYRQLLAVYYESGRYQAAAKLLEKLIKQSDANKDYWLQLSGIYRELGNDKQSLAVMELAYLRGLLTQETELVNLARFYLFMELPYKAGELLEQALRDNSISPSVENWRLLSDAWVYAREPELALAATERALEFTGDGNLRLVRAQLLANSERWSDSLREAKAAIAAGGLDSTGTAHLLMGIAHYKLQQLHRAQASFRHARKFEDTRKQAGRWLGHVKSTPGNEGATQETAHLSPG